VFLEAARRLAADPRRCVVFEDTDIGLEAAKRAGMAAVDLRGWLGGP
jgi:HAD superfamily hydrolase (TIGR01509 family)